MSHVHGSSTHPIRELFSPQEPRTSPARASSGSRSWMSTQDVLISGLGCLRDLIGKVCGLVSSFFLYLFGHSEGREQGNRGKVQTPASTAASTAARTAARTAASTSEQGVASTGEGLREEIAKDSPETFELRCDHSLEHIQRSLVQQLKRSKQQQLDESGSAEEKDYFLEGDVCATDEEMESKMQKWPKYQEEPPETIQNDLNTMIDRLKPENRCVSAVGRFSVGVAQSIGVSKKDEDRFLMESFKLELKGNEIECSLFAVLDGHHGNQAAEYVQANLKEKLVQKIKEFNPNKLSEEGLWKALKMTCVTLNQAFLGTDVARDTDAGTTLAMALILENHLWTANVGDSRIILVDDQKTQQLSEDADPADSRYERGIKKRGGSVQRFNGRVDACGPSGLLVGGLNTARSIGDFYLRGALSARPKITRVALPDGKVKDAHLLLCSDGLVDGVATTIEIGNALRKLKDEDASTIAQSLVRGALLSGARDDVTALAVKL